MLIQLTNDRDEKFYLNADLIERIIERRGGTSEIILTNGNSVECIHSPESIANHIVIMKAQEASNA